MTVIPFNAEYSGARRSTATGNVGASGQPIAEYFSLLLRAIQFNS